MSGILCIAEVRNNALRNVSFEVIAAGIDLKHRCGQLLRTAVIGADSEHHLSQLAIDEVDEVIAATTPNEHFEPHISEQTLECVIGDLKPAVVLLAHSVDSLGFAPAVAARGRHGFAGDVIQLDWSDGLIVRREEFGGKLESELDFPASATTIVTIRVGLFAPVQPSTEADVARREMTLASPTARTEFRGFDEVKSGEVDITKADFILAIGRGVEAEEDVAQFEQLAERLGATLCVSRPLVDEGWVESARAVGQSGKTVEPKVYLALGISGAAQHVAGMRNAKMTIAVNTDPQAPIFWVADYGAVADLFEVAEALKSSPR
jgi:electron transfer flavoprotein alpha subunit